MILTLGTISSVNKDSGNNEWKHREILHAKTINEHQRMQLHQAAVNNLKDNMEHFYKLSHGNRC